MRPKTKPIHKGSKNNKSAKDKQAKQKYTEQGQPIIKNLSDFVVSIKPVYNSKAIYTGGRILSGNNRIYALCNDQIVVYDFLIKKNVNYIKHNNEQIVNFAVDPLEKQIITFTSNFMLRVLNLESGKMVHSLKVDKFYAFDISYSVDGAFVAIGFVNSHIKIFNAQTMKESHSYRQHQFTVRKVQWHPNVENLQVISIDDERNLVVFDFILNKAIAKVADAGKNFVITEKGSNIVTTKDQQIRVYQTKELKLQYKIDVNTYIDALYLCPNNTLVFGGQETELFATDLNDAAHQIKKLKNCTQSGVIKILPVNNKKEFLVVSSEQNLTRVNAQNLLPQETIIGYNDQFVDLKYSKFTDSRFYIMATNSQNVKVMNRKSHELQSLITGHKSIVLTTQYFHPYVLTAGKDKIIKLWKLSETGYPKLIANYRGHSEDISGVSIMYNKKLIVSVSEDKTIKIWAIVQQAQQKVEIKTSLSTMIAHSKAINSVKVSEKDQNLIATCSHDRTINIWEWDNANSAIRLKMTLSGHRRGVWDAIFHKIQSLLVSVGGDGMMKGWNLLTSECIWSMGEGSGLLRCAWLYHNQVVTGSVQGIIKVWDIRKMTSISYDKHGGKIWALDVHHSEENQSKVCQIMSGDNVSKFCVWRDNTEELKNSIIQNEEQNQQQLVDYNLCMHQKKYMQAAKIAFNGNYSNCFVKAVNRIFNRFSENSVVKAKQDGEMICQEEQDLQVYSKEDIINLVIELSNKDVNRFLSYLQTMNSTIKNFKIANRMLYQFVKLRKLRGLESLDKSFVEQLRQSNGAEEVVNKETAFEKYIANMRMLTEKHYVRLEKYSKSSYWFDFIAERDDPFI